jgi:hypothetical protein
MTIDDGLFFRFLIAALASWRVSFLLVRERGPWQIFTHVRRRVVGVTGELLTCVKCVGLWVAIPFAFFVRSAGWELVVTWLALAGSVALIDEWTSQPFEWRDTSSEVDRGESRADDSGTPRS